MKRVFFISFVILGIIFCLSTVSAVDNLNSDTKITNAKADSGLADSAWPTFRHDNQNTGQSIYKGPSINRLKWSYKIGDRRSSGFDFAIGGDGTVYFTNYDNNDQTYLNAVSPSRKLKWTFKGGYIINSPPVIARDGTIYISTIRNPNIQYFYALTPTGRIKWSYKTNIIKENDNGIIRNPVSYPIIGNDGTIYFNGGNNYYYALSSTGKLKWRTKFGSGRYGSQAMAPDGTLYINGTQSNVHYLYAFTSTGRFKWKYRAYSWGMTLPTIGRDGTIYFGCFDGSNGYIYALTPAGKLKWKKGYESPGDIAISRYGTIYYSDDKGYLCAQSTSGNLKWAVKISLSGGPGEASSPTIGSDGTIYVGSSPNNEYGYLYAVAPTGRIKWKYKTKDWVISSPVISKDGTLYFNDLNGYLYAVK